MTPLQNIHSIEYLLPEIFLTAAILLVILMGASKGAWRKGWIPGIAVGGAFMAYLFLLPLYLKTGQSTFHGLLACDEFSLFFKMIFVAATLFVTFMSMTSSEVKTEHHGEYYALLLSAALGLFLMASATDLLMIYIAMELVAIPSYALAGFIRTQRKSSEAALKYVIYGAFASGVMLFGMSMIYGLTGTTSLVAIQEKLTAALSRGAVGEPALLAMILLVFAGFAYKIAAVPFQMWCPDVYEGAPTPITAFLSVAPKAAGFALLIRFFYTSLAAPGTEGTFVSISKNLNWPAIFAVLSAVTMTVGNLCAVAQKNIKRLLAYSSIAHAGYILMGFSLLKSEGLVAMMFYIAVYLFMNLGAFFVVASLAGKTKGEEIEHYRGLGWRSPFAAVALTMFLFSLTGIPIFAGFVGKVYLLLEVLTSRLYWLAVVAILNTVVSLYYYARIVKAMFLDDADETRPIAISALSTTLLVCLLVPTILFGVYWAPLLSFVRYSLGILGA